jgi:hypothetical protein
MRLTRTWFETAVEMRVTMIYSCLTSRQRRMMSFRMSNSCCVVEITLAEAA